MGGFDHKSISQSSFWDHSWHKQQRPSENSLLVNSGPDLAKCSPSNFVLALSPRPSSAFPSIGQSSRNLEEGVLAITNRRKGAPGGGGGS